MKLWILVDLKISYVNTSDMIENMGNEHKFWGTMNF